MKKILNEMYDVLFILLVTGFYTWIANMQTGDPALGGSAIGALILVAGSGRHHKQSLHTIVPNNQAENPFCQAEQRQQKQYRHCLNRLKKKFC